MTDPKIIRYIDQMCVKDGDVEVKNIRMDGSYTLIVPVINGGVEFNEKQIATLDMEFSFDGEDVTLYNFPKQLLTSEDYIFICESIEDELLYPQLSNPSPKHPDLDSVIQSAALRSGVQSKSELQEQQER